MNKGHFSVAGRLLCGMDSLSKPTASIHIEHVTCKKCRALLPSLPLPPSASGLYYIQDTRQVVGNCALWWCPDGKGYTCELGKAGKYGAEEAKRLRDGRDTDIPFPVEVVDAAAVTHCRVETLREFLRGGR